MICEHPSCTGVHGYGKPTRERCPAATARKAAWERAKRTDPEFCQRAVARNREWVQANPERATELRRKYYQARLLRTPEYRAESAERARVWAAANPLKVYLQGQLKQERARQGKMEALTNGE